MSSSPPQVGQGPECLLCLVSDPMLGVAEPLGRPGEAGAAQGATMRDQLDLWIQLAAAVICVHPSVHMARLNFPSVSNVLEEGGRNERREHLSGFFLKAFIMMDEEPFTSFSNLQTNEVPSSPSPDRGAGK